ncbi:MAG: HlyC/CorC family transporter [Firmicutes bacterium]|nr:HlyC/CorC family transporter [Bacillota bacterium]
MLLSILLLIILIFINGIFSASELAFLSLNKIDLKEKINQGSKKAKNIDKILSDSSSFLSTIQIGITLAGFLASALAADYFADYFLNLITIKFITPALLKSILVVIITIILSYFTLVFGELVPKKIAMNNPYKIASTFVGLIKLIQKLFHPLIKILTISTELVCKMFNIKEHNNLLTEEDIRKMILQGKDEGIIEEKEKEYILNVFQFNDTEVSKIMTKKDNVIMLNLDDDIKTNLKIIKESKYSRFPVYQDKEDNIVGVLHVKDFIFRQNEEKTISIKEMIRPIIKFSHQEKIDDVFRNMQEKNESISIIYENEKLVGIVTIEDAVEEIVGNIYDEYDNE